MWQKTPEELRQALSAPFPNGDIEWRLSVTVKDKEKGLAVPYVTNRAIQNRLDDTVGVDGWHNEFLPWKNGNAQLCGISIYFQQLNKWLCKWDGADDSDIESVKGGLSDSMKRAAVEWGIGRYLYGMTQVWVRVEQRGKNYFIADSEKHRLDEAHESWIAKLQGKAAPAPTNANQVSHRQPTPAIPQQNAQQQGGQSVPQRQEKPRQSEQRSDPPRQQSPAPQTPPVQSPPTQAGSGQRAQAPSRGPAPIPEGCYLVQGAVLKPTVSGGSRLNLQLQSDDGQTFQAFLRGGTDGRLAPGVLITNTQFSSRNSGGVTFYVLESYQLMERGMGNAA